MSNLTTMCAQASLATTSFVQNRLTTEFIKTNKFLNGVEIISTEDCVVYGEPMAGGVKWIRNKGTDPCGKVNDTENTYKGRMAVLQDMYVSKKLCKKRLMCSSFSAEQFAQLMRNEFWQGFIEALEAAYFEAIFSDDTTYERGCTGVLEPVKVIDDNLTGTTITKVEKATFTADTAVQWLAGLVSKFRAANIGATGITIFMPYELELLISGAMANKQCCQWYSDIMFDGNTSGYTINGMQITIVCVDKSRFPAGAAGYTRIAVVANNRIRLVYNSLKIYGNLNNFALQYLDPRVVQAFYATLPTTSMIDFSVDKGDSDDIGVVMRMKALAHVEYYRMQKNSIMLVDVKNDALV